MRYVDVILPLPLDGVFTYAISDELAARAKAGMRVVVPFNKSKRYTAIIVSLHDRKPDFEVKPAIELLDSNPILLPVQLQLWQWISQYYMAPLGEVMNAALPAGLKNEEGYRPKTETYIGLCEPFRNEQALHIALDMLQRAEKQQKVLVDFLSMTGYADTIGQTTGDAPRIAEVTRDELMNESHCTAAVLKSLIDRKILYTYEREVGRLNHGGEPHPECVKKLNAVQQNAYNQLLFQFLRKKVVLLHGVTSSGKTEIYIHLIQKTLDQGKQVLYLLPEIALTVQMMDRLRAVFGNRLGIYHSRYSDAERVEIWQKQLSRNPYDVILGARSAVFLPFQRLGLVIVDEEHETSFKQQDPAPRYHARSVAIMMGAPSNLPQLGEAAAVKNNIQQIIDHYKTAHPVSYATLKQYSIEQRNCPTEAEKAMWELLRGKNLHVKFRRQHIICDFIVDFVCLENNLVIEIDGGYHLSHEQKEADQLRTSMLRDMGFVELRFTNNQVLHQPDEVLQTISKSLASLKASPSWGRLEGAKILLGTATPSMESYYNAQSGKYGLVTLQTRYQGIELPEIEVVDVKDLRRRKMMSGPFSPQLLAAVRKALGNQEQVILFQNRRGFAPMMECNTCGWVPRCKNCDVSLTLHKNTNTLTCHYCGYTYTVPTHCPSCEGTDLRGRGYGTEKIEDQLRDLFPEARIARMDLDTTRSRNAYERLIGDFASGRTNVLIGTQMISKGLDFDRVSVVGILDADTMLNYPDFRAYEHAFMMMAQVSGRAGRKGKRGHVLLQTRNKELPVIMQVVQNDYVAFYQELLEERRQFRYPPFCHLVYVYLRHKAESTVESASIYMGSLLRQWFGERVLGPDKPGISKVKTLHIRKIVLKLENGIDLKLVREYLSRAQQQLLQDKQYASLQVFFDVDPL